MTQPDPSSPGLDGELIGSYRTTPAIVLGWVMVAGAALLTSLTVVDVLAGRADDLLTPVALICGIAALAWVLFLRPRVRVHSDGVVLHNVVSDTTVPFAAVEEITHQWALELHDTEGRRHSAWAVPVKRERVRRTGVDDFAETTTRRRGDAGRTAQGVADIVQRTLQRWRLDGGQLSGTGDLARPGGPGPAPTQVHRAVAWAPVAGLGLSLLLLVLAVLG